MRQAPNVTYSLVYVIIRRGLTWLGGICLPLMRSSKTVPKLNTTLSGVTLPDTRGTNTNRIHVFI